jgi:tellurite resistance protein TerC
MRAVFIGIGAALLEAFSLVFLLFGLLLIYAAIQLFRHRNEDPDIEGNIMIRGARRLLPITDQYGGGKSSHVLMAAECSPHCFWS